jgi:hypothetical protein
MPLSSPLPSTPPATAQVSTMTHPFLPGRQHLLRPRHRANLGALALSLATLVSLASGAQAKSCQLVAQQKSPCAVLS